MKTTICLLLAALLAAPAARGAEAAKDKTPRVPAAEAEKRETASRPAPRKRPFTPREKISAGQAVTFPADI